MLILSQVLLLPDFSATSAYYGSQSAQDQRGIIEPCLPREASESQTLLPECEEPTFTLSTEFYGTVFGRLFWVVFPWVIQVIILHRTQPVSVILLGQRRQFAILTVVVAPVKMMLPECSVIGVLKEHSI